MALDTACKHHPHAEMNLWYVPEKVAIDADFLPAFQAKGCMLRLRPFDAKTFFQGTPFGAWMYAPSSCSAACIATPKPWPAPARNH